MHINKQILFKRIKILFLPCNLLAALAAFFLLVPFITLNNTNVVIRGQVKYGSSHVYDQFDVTSRHGARLFFLLMCACI